MSPKSKDAIVFCAQGALVAARHQGKHQQYEYLAARNLLHIAIYKLTGVKYRISNFNDSHAHHQVLKAFDKAIRMEKRGPK